MPTEAPSSTSKDEPDERRLALLDAAVTTFIRFGFRKTSMSEVARAAGISRQGLYLHFATKEQLFRAAAEHALDASLTEALSWLRDDSQSLEARLGGALSAWVGRYVGGLAEDFADLHAVTERLVGPLFAEREACFVAELTKLVRSSGLGAAYRPAGLSAKKLAGALYDTARGLKHACASRRELNRRLSAIVRAWCLPLRTSV